MTKLHATKLCVRKMVCVCDKDVCDKVVWRRCVLKMVCDNDVGVCVCDNDVCVKDGV